MMTNRIKILILMLVFSTFYLCFSVVTIHADEGKVSIGLAILPCGDPLITYKKFYWFATYLEQETGFDINLVVPKNLEEFKGGIKLKNTDFAFLGAHTYVSLAHWFDQNSLLRVLTIQGKPLEYGVVLVKKNSGIKKIEDLKGKTVMFGSRLSASKWIAARLLFRKKGINIYKDLLGYSNGDCCEDIAFSVFLNKVDAGVVCDHFITGRLPEHSELGIESGQFVIIAKTDLVPSWVFVARKGLRPNIINTFNQTLLRLDKNRSEHKYILNHAELGGFQKSKDEYYDCIRRMINLLEENKENSLQLK